MRASAICRHTTRSALLSAAAIAGIAVVLAACASSNSGGGTTSRTGAPSTSATSAAPSTSTAAPSTSATSAAPTTSSPGTPKCATSALRGEVNLAASSGAAGSIYYPLDLTNTSESTCTLYGYPGVSFVTGPSGTQLGAAAHRNPVTAAATVTLDPGQVAHAILQVAEAGNYDQTQCKPVTAHYLSIYPPDQSAAIIVPFTTQACSATLPASIGSQIAVTVIQPGVS